MTDEVAHPSSPLARWHEIPLASILGEIAPEDCKVHCAVPSPTDHPLEAFAQSWDEWVLWNRYRPEVHAFNRRYVFSLMQSYEPATWIFGGLFEVTGDTGVPRTHAYSVELVDHPMQAWIGRLKVRYAHKGRNIRVKFESVVDSMQIAEVLPVRYAGKPFPGHDRIEHSFRELAVVYQQQRPDWRVALEHMKGVYVLHDKHTGKSYVGSACGDTGLWMRWGQYVATGHGGNVDLQALVNQDGIEYVREHFTFALLEYWSMRTPDDYVIERESYWKRVLLSREFGYNAN